MYKHRIQSGLAIVALGLLGAIGTLRIDSRDATTGHPSEDPGVPEFQVEDAHVAVILRRQS